MSKLLNFSVRKNYIPAVAKCYKCIGYVVEWYIYDENKGKLVRKLVKLNRIKQHSTARDFKIYVANLVQSINNQLACSFLNENFTIQSAPIVACSAPADAPSDEIVHVEETKKAVPIKDTADKFIVEKSKELRPDSIRSYKSFVKILLEWCIVANVKSVTQIDSSVAVEFFDYLYNEREVSAVSFNNYLKLARAFASWCMQKNLIRENPFAIIKKKRTDMKNRTLISADDRRRLLDSPDIRETFKFLCILVYSALLRPREISKIQIKHIHLEAGYIEVPDNVAKNHKKRVAALTPQLVEALRSMNLDRFPLDYYLFGSQLLPSEQRAGDYCYMKYWRKVREILNYPPNYTLYSFRDTGITDMLEAGIPSIEVMKHADHSSLDITTIYAKHIDKQLIHKISTRAPRF